MGTFHIEAEQLLRVAAATAASLLTSKAGRRAGYWEKPIFGKPRVGGTAMVNGTFHQFLLGASLAGYCREAGVDRAPALIPDAYSLAAYYLAFPGNAELLDAHFRATDEYARDVSPDVFEFTGGDVRQAFLGSTDDPPEQVLMPILWSLVRQQAPFSIDTAKIAFVAFFLYGAAMPEQEVQRLWGTQISTPWMPLMEESLSVVREDLLASTVR